MENIKEVKKQQTLAGRMCKLSASIELLGEMTSGYKAIVFERVPTSSKTKKAVQSSIVELCTVISELVTED